MAPSDAVRATAAERPVLPLAALEYVIVDVETTGGSARYGHRVTEVAAIRVDGAGRVLEEFSTLVNPERPIPPRITALTRITDAMVRDAPRFGEIADRVRRLLEGRVFVAHNVSFDWSFLRAEMARATGLEPHDGQRLCTVRLARRLVPEVERRSLDVLIDFFGVENEARHRAYGDARATAVIFRRLLERLDERGVRSWPQLQSFLDASRRRRRRAADTTNHGEG